MYRTITLGALAGVLLIGLSACGADRGERALTGGAIGAAGGAVGGALVGAPLTGAAIGAAGGAAIGAFTDENDIDLGEPIWD